MEIVRNYLEIKSLRELNYKKAPIYERNVNSCRKCTDGDR